MGEKFNRTMTEAALKANKANAQKSTGPKTEDGKAASSMNRLTTGKYATKFWKIPGTKAGQLEMCNICGDEQKTACKEAKTCLLHNELTLAYMKTHDTGNTKYVENFNILQLATMDLIFSQKLRYAQIHMGEQETYIDSDGNERTKEKIDIQYIYALMNMMKSLNKSMPDMQLTKQTQENIDVAWAELAKANIDPEKATENRHKIITGMAVWREAHGPAEEMEKLDEAITEHRKAEKSANADTDDNNISNLGHNPFGKK